MKRTIATVSVLTLFVWGNVLCSDAHAQKSTQEDDTSPTIQTASKINSAASYTTKGADTCAMCHDEDSVLPVLSIYKTKHAQATDKRTPFSGLQCEACHGPGAEHAKWVQPGEKQSPIVTFGKHSKLTSKQQNQICLDCHQGQDRIAWHNSSHQSNEMTCTRCHQIHSIHDPVLATRSQPDVCYQCHKKARSEFLKPSKHPVGFGKMTCSDCHQVHGSNTETLLNQMTVNDTCYTCHAEKRGPLLWEHAPVTEDCRICHVAHGSVQPSLLTKRAPLLCQQCHSQLGHPSVPRSTTGLPGNSPTTYLLSGSCTNCHSQVHGSNHPSGSRLMR